MGEIIRKLLDIMSANEIVVSSIRFYAESGGWYLNINIDWKDKRISKDLYLGGILDKVALDSKAIIDSIFESMIQELKGGDNGNR